MKATSCGRHWLGCVAIGAALAAQSASSAEYWAAVGASGDGLTEASPGELFAVAAKATADGDVIHVATGTYEFSGKALSVARGVTLIGGSDDPAQTVIRRTGIQITASTNDRVINVGKNGVLRNLTASGGYTVYQAATVLGYDAASNVHKVFTVSNCVVENGSALYKGGGSYGGTWRDCVIRNCAVRNTSAQTATEGSGGGVWGGTLYNCVVTNNTACYAGGGIAGSDAEPCVAYDCTFANNTAPYGAGAGTQYAPTACRLYRCSVVSNDCHNAQGQAWGGKGGGTYGCFVTNSLIAWNKTRFDNTKDGTVGGGAGVCRGRVYDSTIQGNYTTKYGNLYIVDGGGAEAAYLENCRIIDNFSVRYAGGTLTCTNVHCLISGNQGSIGGGTFQGVNVDCVICSNEAYAVQGGACYNSSTYNCLIFGNTTAQDGTLCRGYHQGDIIVNNVTKSGERGSAIDSPTNDKIDATAVNCTVVGNSGPSRAQVFLVAVTNSIVRGGSGTGFEAEVVYGTAVNSLYGSRSGGSAAIDCLPAGTDPMFVTEPKEGECAYSLKPDSPCVGAGLNLDWMVGAKDILGNARLFKHNPIVDIGACECWWKTGMTLIFK